uniref:ArsR/SmtB family transcription factor n=1 Tax=Ectobacillus panaciterrae TaxID=363872 RepID=UPI0012DC584D
ENYEEIAEILKVLAHPIRLSLVKIMLTKGPTNVKAMYEELQIHQSTVSQHLSKLKGAKIISGTREGLEVYYKIVDNRIKTILSSFA